MCILKVAVMVLFVTHQGPRKVQGEKKSAQRRSRNASASKVNLCVQLTESTVILAVVHSSLKAHQSENEVPYFH